jgi:DNA-binding XRE family transcriptional regulator
MAGDGPYAGAGEAEMQDAQVVTLIPRRLGKRGAAASHGVWSSGTEPLHVVLGRRLRRLRIERGLRRRTVAARLGLSVERVEGHERGTTRIEARELVAYAQFFGVRLSTFFRDPSKNDRA